MSGDKSLTGNSGRWLWGLQDDVGREAQHMKLIEELLVGRLARAFGLQAHFVKRGQALAHGRRLKGRSLHGRTVLAPTRPEIDEDGPAIQLRLPERLGEKFLLTGAGWFFGSAGRGGDQGRAAPKQVEGK